MAVFLMSSISILLRLSAALLAYWIARAIYRITFHPLAGFPGPKLAAITSMYGGWYDLRFAPSYCKQWPALHEKYGPIVRILPNQLHIRDMQAYNQVYKPGTKFAKDPDLYYLPITAGSMFDIHETKAAKRHKDMYQPYFSRTAIQHLETEIRGHCAKFLAKLADAASQSKVVDLTLAYKCLTADVVMNYCFQKTFGALDAPDFQFPLIVDIEEFFETATFSWYFKTFFVYIFIVIAKLPRSWVRNMIKPLGATYAIQDGCKARILELQAESQSAMSSTVFRTALHPDVEKDQPKLDLTSLSADALLFFVAGTDTTAHALTMGTWYLTKDPHRLAKLRKELESAIPDATTLPLRWGELEKLPYLHAVIKESLRFSFGVPGKLPRVVPESGATFCGCHIPPGTVVSQSAYVIQMDGRTFDDPHAFIPERWLGTNSAELEQHLVSFSRGSRSCLGINLAYAELYTAFAYVFRRFDFTLHETTDHDMDWHDAFTPASFGHLKVKVEDIGQQGN